MAITVSLDEIELTDSVSQMVSSLNSNSTAITNGFNSVPTYSTVSQGSAGLCPALPSSSASSKFLRGDGTWNGVPSGTTSAAGIVQLNSATNSTSETQAATPKAVKAAYDLANGKVSCTEANVKSAIGAGSGTKFYRQDGTWQNTPYPGSATTSAAGIVQLNSATNSTSTTQAATPSAVKAAYDLANGKVSCTTDNVKSALGTSSGGTTFLRKDGTWATPTNTTYGNASTSSAGLVSTGAQSFGGVKTFADTTAASSTSTGAVKISGGLGVAKYIYGDRVYNAVWNDYAECRETEEVEAGRCLTECEDGIMRKTTKRLQPGCKIASDTFGSCMGETEKAKTPIGVAGRVLAYPYKGKKFKVGDAVCSAPDGTVDVMSRLEVILFPDRIVGTVSEIPKYEEWISGTKENPQTVKVNGRIWVYVR